MEGQEAERAKEDLFRSGSEVVLESPVESHIRFHTFHVVDREGMEIGKIVTAVLKEGENFKMACAFCSPKDQFDREYGQFIAYRRLMYSPKGRGSVVEFTRNPGDKVLPSIRHNCLTLAAHYPVRWVLQEVDTVDQLK